MNSTARAWTFLLGLSMALLLAGQALGGREGVLWAVIVSLSINAVVYFYTDQRLRQLFHGRLIEGQDPWGLAQMTQEISRIARIRPPIVIVLDREGPQAFSFGRNRQAGTIVLTEGLLNTFSRPELKAVLAYQIACIQRMDTLVFGVASSVCGALLFCTQSFDKVLRWVIGAKKGAVQGQLFTVLLAPLAGMALRLCVRPSHYFAIDAQAAELIGDSRTMAQALWKLESYASTNPFSAPPSTSHYFMVNPLTANTWTRYFRVQPEVERRIKKLVGYFPI